MVVLIAYVVALALFAGLTLHPQDVQ